MVMLACAAVSQAAEVKIRVAGFGGTDTAIVEELIARFVQPNLKEIQVVYEPIPDSYDKWIVNALSAGTGPDLFYVDIFWSQGLFSSGAVEPLDSYLAKSQVLKEKDIIPALLNAFTYNGKVYGIPKDFNTLALIYNKDMFDIAKVPYPDENDDWNTFTDKLRKVQAAFPGVYGVCLSPEFARMGAFAYATGFKSFDKDGKTDILSHEAVLRISPPRPGGIGQNRRRRHHTDIFQDHASLGPSIPGRPRNPHIPGHMERILLAADDTHITC